ncbi:MAG TPA: nitroreductase family deazaflavin-dependent oxidoreductase [Nocardioidaceae bacterium]|nr:nitroreductase family deazaflavin-dependent oxidoreductase [Nocardioidaceae bacterium]
MNILTPVAIRVGRLSWLPRYLKQIVALDKAIHRVSRGRFGLLAIAGLPQVMLTVRGRKSGIPRSTPLLCTPYDGSFLVAGSNWGAPKLPVWVLNLRADPDAEVLHKGRSLPVHAREVTGEERDRLWQVMVRTWPNYERYAERTDRVIPVFVLAPRD